MAAWPKLQQLGLILHLASKFHCTIHFILTNKVYSVVSTIHTHIVKLLPLTHLFIPVSNTIEVHQALFLSCQKRHGWVGQWRTYLVNLHFRCLPVAQLVPVWCRLSPDTRAYLWTVSKHWLKQTDDHLHVAYYKLSDSSLLLCPDNISGDLLRASPSFHNFNQFKRSVEEKNWLLLIQASHLR